MRDRPCLKLLSAEPKRPTWTIVREADPNERDERRWIASIQDDGIEVARLEVFGDDTPSHRGARTVAGSPDLYRLLSEAVAWMDADHRATELSRSIVAEAKAVLAWIEGGSR